VECTVEDPLVEIHRAGMAEEKRLCPRPLQNIPFCPISLSGSNFNPQNTQCMSACPVGPADRTGVVKIFAFLELEQNFIFFKGLYPPGKYYSKASVCLK
jgi:hypothetical protein